MKMAPAECRRPSAAGPQGDGKRQFYLLSPWIHARGRCFSLNSKRSLKDCPFSCRDIPVERKLVASKAMETIQNDSYIHLHFLMKNI